MEARLSTSWLNFERGINCEATRVQYGHSLKRYMRFVNTQDPDDLLKLDKQGMEDSLMDFIATQKAEGVGAGLIRVRLAAIKKFYKRNRVSLQWDLILETVGKTKKLKKDRAYSREEIKQALDIANHREKVMVLIPASSGVRRGGMLGLRKRNLESIERFNIYKLTVYEGESEEYKTYCTPECKKAIDDYLDYRTRCGEVLGPDSYVVRDAFNLGDAPRIATGRPLGPRGCNDVIERLMERANVRKPIILMEGQKPSHVRHDIKTIHGFRKFFDTQMTLSGVPELYTQLLEGHEIGLKGAYLRPTEDDLLLGNDKMRGYVSAIDDLTINDEHRLKRKVIEAEKKAEGFEKAYYEAMSIRKELERKGVL